MAVRKDGTCFWANVIVTALRDENGEVVGFAKVTRDLTERRAAEQQAVRLAAGVRRARAAEARSARARRTSTNSSRSRRSSSRRRPRRRRRSPRDWSRPTSSSRKRSSQAEAARAAAEASERYAREILESIADPFVVQDAQWRFRYINAKAAEILGAAGRSRSS